MIKTPDPDQLLLDGIDPELPETQEMMETQILKKMENEKNINQVHVKEINEAYTRIQG